MIHLRVYLTNGDIFECDHKAKTFKSAAEDIVSQPYLFFENTVVNVGQIVSIENIKDNDRVKELSVSSGSRNKGSLS